MCLATHIVMYFDSFVKTPSFYCPKGQVSLLYYSLPKALKDLVNDNSEVSSAFRTHIQNYNNVFVFISLSIKYDKLLRRNDKSIYTFCVQGMVHHFIDTIVPSNERSTNL